MEEDVLTVFSGINFQILQIKVIYDSKSAFVKTKDCYNFYNIL